jgi:hypothetical protein
MKIISFIFVFIIFPVSIIIAEEIDLYDASGTPTAYITKDDFTIYLWSGEPVAYLDESRQEFNIYGFNGKHLGWFKGGAIFDHDGFVVGGVKEIFRTAVQYSGYKSFKQFKPFKSFKEFEPFAPYFQMSWSKLILKDFLMNGSD